MSEPRHASASAQVANESSLPRGLFAWALVDQSVASATTFFLTIVAARELGPTGLGAVAIGLAGFYIVYGLGRSLIVNPFLARDSSLQRSAHEALRSAISITVAGSFVVTVAGVAVGLMVTDSVTRGVLIFAPWIVPAVTQDVIKASLYRQGRGANAAASSLAWLIVMLVAMAFGLRQTDWQVAAAWGLGSCVALLVAALGAEGVGLAAPRAAVRWFTDEAARLGGWLAFSGVIYAIATYMRLVGYSSILGPAAVGGYRAIETAFAPASLIGPALTNPGVATLRDTVEDRRAQAWRMAVRISLLAVALAVVYVTLVVMARKYVFLALGTEFRRYEDLILPIAVGQILASATTGFGLLLVAARRMRAIALLTITESVLALCLSLALALVHGLEGAAWGVAAAGVPSLVLSIVLARSAVRALAHSAPSDPTALIGEGRQVP